MKQRDRRALVLGLAILVPSLGWVYAGRPMLAALASLNERIGSEQEALGRERAAVAEATRNPGRKAIADSAVAAVGSRVFSGANDVAAGATLATYVGDVARRSHVWLASATTRSSTSPAGSAPNAPVAPGAAAGGRGGQGAGAAGNSDGVRPLRVDLRGESDYQGVLEFLNALERGEKLVVVERLDIARTLRAGDDDSETLSITATVVGYALASPAPAAPVSAGRATK
ncbi:MAG: hypothetical protein IT356_07050 [Gemmatimonadaceae bacterium]|nr:hypothetical protein [Gemmatimonadaceae bacterium]